MSGGFRPCESQWSELRCAQSADHDGAHQAEDALWVDDNTRPKVCVRKVVETTPGTPPPGQEATT